MTFEPSTDAEDAVTREVNSLYSEARELAKKKPLLKEDTARISALLEPAKFRKDGMDPETREREQDFNRYLRYGINGMEPEEKDRLFQHRASWSRTEFRAPQGVGTGAIGGYIAPDSVTTAIEEALKHYSAVRRVATVMPTATGTDLSYPSVDDTAQIGELLAENLAAAEQDVAFNTPVVFKSWKYSSKLVLVSTELLQDSATDIETLLASLFARRIGVLENQHLTVGTGTGQPQGVLTAATLGKTGLAGQVSTVLYDDFVDLLHSVDPLYRASPSCVWMMRDLTLREARKIKDTAGQPIVTSPSQDSANRDYILGHPVIPNPDMPLMAASAKSILFGDFSRYYVRDVLPFAVLRLSERFADKLQTGFLAFLRSDGKLLDAGTHPLKFYQNASA